MASDKQAKLYMLEWS